MRSDRVAHVTPGGLAGRLLFALALAALSLGAAAQNWTGLWWNAAEPGWGVNFSHQGDIVFATLFTYDADGRPAWLVMADGRAKGGGTYSGTLYRMRGKPLGPGPFPAATPAAVGSMEVTFHGAASATLRYDWDGATVTKEIAPQVFGAAAASCRSTTATRASATNYQDLWWNPAEPGWGMNIAHQDDILFATLFGYADDESPAWHVMSSGTRQPDGAWSGDLHRIARGSPFDAPTHVPLAPGDVVKVGTMRLAFTDGETGTLTYSISGREVSRPITRQVFATPWPDCGALAPVRYDDANAYSDLPDASLAAPNEGAAVSEASIVLGARRRHYTAVAGHLTAADPQGVARASMFYVAYVGRPEGAAERPVIFFYNGGPGVSTTILHLGSFGPKRLETHSPAIDSEGRFDLVDNAESLIDVADLVFVDAVGTGYSQAIAPHRNRDFWGVGADADVFRDFVRRYVEANGRQGAPRFLYGESYGGIRSAVLARRLEEAGLPLAGVIFQSPILDYNSNCSVAPVSCAWFLPSYGAVGISHGRVAAAQPLPDFLAEARTFAAERYHPAVVAWMQGRTLPGEAVLAGLVERTGLASQAWTTQVNMDPAQFRSIYDGASLLGRYDGRISAPKDSPPARVGDPSYYGVALGFSAAIEPLLGGLGYTARSRYVFRSFALTGWRFDHNGLARPDGIVDLAAALALNRSLRVLAMSGRHDLATPVQLTENDLARLDAGARVITRHYDGGHMSYLDQESRRLQKRDVAAFLAGQAVPLSAKAAAPGLEAAFVPRASAPRAAAWLADGWLQDPWVPPAVRALPAAPPATGEALRRKVGALLGAAR